MRLRHVLPVLLVGVSILVVPSLTAQQTKATKKHTSISVATKADSLRIGRSIYRCPMDSDIVAAKPGKCPKCGMTLVKSKK